MGQALTVEVIFCHGGIFFCPKLLYSLNRCHMINSSVVVMEDVIHLVAIV